MTHRTIRMIIEQQDVITAPGNTSVIAAARLMKENHVGAVMVVEEDGTLEKLEQLRALEMDMNIYALVVEDAPLSVDNPADLDAAITYAQTNGL